MKKMTAVILTLALLLLLPLSGCFKQSLPDDFEQAEIEDLAADVIHWLNTKDAKKLLDRSTVQLKSALTDEVLANIFEAIGEGGEFVEIESIAIGGKKDSSSQEEFAVAVVNARYEIRRFTFTLSFTKQLKLAGLYYK